MRGLGLQDAKRGGGEGGVRDAALPCLQKSVSVRAIHDHSILCYVRRQGALCNVESPSLVRVETDGGRQGRKEEERGKGSMHFEVR